MLLLRGMVFLGLGLIACACAKDEPRADCLPGVSLACACPDQRVGARLCDSGGHFSDCVCTGSGGTGAIGGASGTGGTGGTGAISGSGGTGAISGSGGTGAIGGTGGTGIRGTVIPDPTDEAAYLFDQTQVRTYELSIAQSDLDAINADPVAEQYVSGMLTFEGNQIGPIGVRYKGSIGAFFSCVQNGGFMPSGPKTCRKLSMKLAFDWVDPEARFFGVRKLNFHSMNADRSQLRDRLGYWLFRQMGVPAPRAVHAKLVINGVTEGLFALVEQVDGRFTRSRFTEGGEGNLYKEIWPMHATEPPYLNALESNRSEMPNASKILAFRNALSGANDSTLGTVIDAQMNRDITIRYVAVDRTILNDDGAFHFYCSLGGGQGNNPGSFGNHNYYIYEEANSDQVWVIPWDLDLSFAGETTVTRITTAWNNLSATCSCGIFGNGQVPPACDPLIRGWALMTPEYNAARRALLDGPFSATSVDAQLDTWIAQLTPVVTDVATDPRQLTVSQWQSAITNLRNTINTLRTTAENETP